MRKVILSMHITLDGFISGSNGRLDWTSPVVDKDEEAAMMDHITTIVAADTVLIGRGVYPDMANAWPKVAVNPSTSKREAEFARKINAIHKIVFSDSEEKQEKLEWNNATLLPVKGNLSEEVAKLKRQSGKDMVLYGGVRIAQSFVQLGLVDEYQLFVHPVALGNGKPLFNDIKDRINLKLVNAKTYKNGVVLLDYLTIK
jgi:dihydrofolate reductase